MICEIFDDRQCALGEGPLWHPIRKQLYWFDITGKKLLSRATQGSEEWAFPEETSAAGWIDKDSLLIASATGLWRFDLATSNRKLICPLESSNAVTRSNDGRADPWGGFWISTMGRAAEPGAGSIYRFYQGQLRRLIGDLTIPNAICFAPNRSTAYFTDTAKMQIMKTPLDRNGWPSGTASIFVDLAAECLNPDGAVTDQSGMIWNAQWGAGRIAAYTTDGRPQQTIDVPALNASCPAFGGPDLTTMFVTSATQGVQKPQLNQENDHGKTFALLNVAQGVPEPQVIL